MKTKRFRKLQRDLLNGSDMHMGEAVFKCLETKRGKYVYDRYANTVFTVSGEEYDEFCQIAAGALDQEESSVLKYYQMKGAFKDFAVEEIVNPASDYICHLLESKTNRITLQVTQQCNLRCAYCVYSGLYDNRTHSSKSMTFETAKKAIDFLLSHSREENELHISFYGGEPLLEFDLIQQCVGYIHSINESKKITFGMTTNGTLINEKIADFLYNENFMLSISLDGSKEDHDRNRKFSNGKGSFDLILKNLGYILDKYPDYSRKINFLATISPNTDMESTIKYFDLSDFFKERQIMYNMMSGVGLKKEVMYGEEGSLVKKYEYLKVLLAMINKVDKGCLSTVTNQISPEHKNFYRNIKMHIPLKSRMHHGGPCIPGYQKLFINVEGEFFPCEKVSETACFFSIGNVDKGYDIPQILKIINIGKITEDECKRCWNLRNCKICAARFEIQDEPDKYNKLKVCRDEKNKAIADLYELCVLKEFGYTVSGDEV